MDFVEIILILTIGFVGLIFILFVPFEPHEERSKSLWQRINTIISRIKEALLESLASKDKESHINSNLSQY